MPAYRGNNTLDDVHQVSIVLEHRDTFFKNPSALHVNVLETIDQNVVDAGVLQQRLERSQAENFIQHFPRQRILLRRRERGIEVLDQNLNNGEHLRAHVRIPRGYDFLDVDFGYQFAVYGRFKFLIVVEP